MLTPLLTYIRERSITPLTDADLSLLQEAFIPARLRKRQFFLKEGEVCEYFAFIVKGAMRQYSIDSDGQLQILNLCIENWWISDRESFHKSSFLPRHHEGDAEPRAASKALRDRFCIKAPMP
jgi:CRP-like cAMP-binding protein